MISRILVTGNPPQEAVRGMLHGVYIPAQLGTSGAKFVYPAALSCPSSEVRRAATASPARILRADIAAITIAAAAATEKESVGLLLSES